MACISKLPLAQSQPDKGEPTSDNHGNPAYPLRNRPIANDDGPLRKNRTKWNSATIPKISPATKENVFWSMANQPTRWRTLVRVATSSRSFFAIKYANELPNRTVTQVGVLSDTATTAPSSSVSAWRILSPSLMLMPLSFSSPRSRLAQRHGSSETFSSYSEEIRKCVN